MVSGGRVVSVCLWTDHPLRWPSLSLLVISRVHFLTQLAQWSRAEFFVDNHMSGFHIYLSGLESETAGIISNLYGKHVVSQ